MGATKFSLLSWQFYGQPSSCIWEDEMGEMYNMAQSIFCSSLFAILCFLFASFVSHASSLPRRGWNDVPMEWQIVRGHRPSGLLRPTSAHRSEFSGAKERG